MDGARFANAVVALGVTPKEITWQAGVDVLCFGGSKNGIALGEAVVFFNPEVAREFDYRCKQGGQLASKMRFLSAPWVGMLQEGAWLRHARHAQRHGQTIGSCPSLPAGPPHRRPGAKQRLFANFRMTIVQGMYQRGWKFYTQCRRGTKRG